MHRSVWRAQSSQRPSWKWTAPNRRRLSIAASSAQPASWQHAKAPAKSRRLYFSRASASVADRSSLPGVLFSLPGRSGLSEAAGDAPGALPD